MMPWRDRFNSLNEHVRVLLIFAAVAVVVGIAIGLTYLTQGMIWIVLMVGGTLIFLYAALLHTIRDFDRQRRNRAFREERDRIMNEKSMAAPPPDPVYNGKDWEI